MAVSATTENGSGSSASFDTWYAGAKAKVLDLDVSDDDLIKYIGQQFQAAGSGGADSEAKRSALQQLVDLRTRIATAMSTMLQALAQAAHLIIANMRS